MPLINLRLIENVFTAEQKRRMIHDLTEAMVAIEGESMRAVTWVIIDEVRSGDWALGGRAITTEAVHQMQQGAAV